MMIKKIIFLAVILTARPLGCSAPGELPDATPVSTEPRGVAQTSPNYWRILSFGDYMQRALWNDPCVLKIGNEYVMYATANVGGKWGKVLPFRGTSDDGINWDMDVSRPLLGVGEKGSFDEDSVETPSVVFFKNQYHMYYTGVVRGLRQKMAIGHAVSDDGIVWRKLSADPILKPTGNFLKDWNGFHVAEPGAVVFKGKVYLYMHASGRREGGKSPGNQSVIALSTSDDGHNFTPMQKVLTQGPTYPTTAPEVFVGYSTPSAIVVNGKVHLFYDVIATKPKWEQVALHHAVSSDGRKFREDTAPLLTRRDLSWTRTGLRAPSVLYENGQFRMWFAGHDIDTLADSGIGYTTLKLY